METDSLRRHLAGSRDRSITVPGYFSHRCTAPEFPETFLAKLNIITKGRHCLLQKNKNNINKTQIPGGWMVALPEHPEFPFSLGPMQPQHPGLQSELQKRDLTSSPSEAGGFFIVQEYKTTVISVQGEEKIKGTWHCWFWHKFPGDSSSITAGRGSARHCLQCLNLQHIDSISFPDK